MKVYIHIWNSNISFDRDVRLIEEMPYIPAKGTMIFLTSKQKECLEEQIRWSSKWGATDYEHTFYGGMAKYKSVPSETIPGCFTPEELEGIDICDCVWVYDIMYSFHDNAVHIELAPDMDMTKYKH